VSPVTESTFTALIPASKRHKTPTVTARVAFLRYFSQLAVRLQLLAGRFEAILKRKLTQCSGSTELYPDSAKT
jgi:hypothetical protein